MLEDELVLELEVEVDENDVLDEVDVLELLVVVVVVVVVVVDAEVEPLFCAATAGKRSSKKKGQ